MAACMFTELRPDGFSTKLRIGSPRFDNRDTNGACQLCEAPPAVYTTRLPPEHEIGWRPVWHATKKERGLRQSDQTIAAPCTPMARPTNTLSRSATRPRDDADAESRVTRAEWMHSSASPDGHGAFGVNPLDLGRRRDRQGGVQYSGSMGSALSGAAAARASPSSSTSEPDGMMT